MTGSPLFLVRLAWAAVLVVGLVAPTMAQDGADADAPGDANEATETAATEDSQADEFWRGVDTLATYGRALNDELADVAAEADRLDATVREVQPVEFEGSELRADDRPLSTASMSLQFAASDLELRIREVEDWLRDIDTGRAEPGTDGHLIRLVARTWQLARDAQTLRTRCKALHEQVVDAGYVSDGDDTGGYDEAYDGYDDSSDYDPGADDTDGAAPARRGLLGWTALRPRFETRVSISPTWIAHDYDSRTTSTDLSMFLEVAADTDDSVASLGLSAWILTTYRSGSDIGDSGFGDLWVGVKFGIGDFSDGYYGMAITNSFGFASGRRVNGAAVSFDPVNHLVVKDFSYDLGFTLWASGERGGISLESRIFMTFGFELEVSHEFTLEYAWQPWRHTVLRFGFHTSSAFVPFEPYTEWAWHPVTALTVAFRAAFPVGQGTNDIGPTGDVLLSLGLQWSFG